MQQAQKIFTTLSLIILVAMLAGCGSAVARHNNQGNAEYQENNFSEALEQYRQAQQENPDLPEPYYNSGNTYHRQGDMNSAATQLKQSNRLAAGELAQHSHYNLGNTYFKEEDWESAIEAYKEALRLNPNDEEAKYNLELALQQQEQEQQQQQQQQQGGGGQPPPENENQQPGDQGEQDQPQNQGGEGEEEEQQGGGGDQPEQDQSGSGQNQDQQSSGGSRGLTQQEAEQLLDALGQDSQTLQERLQRGFGQPGLPPQKDW